MEREIEEIKITNQDSVMKLDYQSRKVIDSRAMALVLRSTFLYFYIWHLIPLDTGQHKPSKNFNIFWHRLIVQQAGSDNAESTLCY